jgi:tetraacyldisaccharide 4'-kinase
VARPQRVREAAEAQGVTLAGHLAFPDHHRYPASSLRRVDAELHRVGAAGVLTTAKDRGKLTGRLAAPLWVLPLLVQPEAALWVWLADRLAAAGFSHPGRAPVGDGLGDNGAAS